MEQLSEVLGANAALLWLTAAALLASAELIAPGVFLVFLAAAAAITGVTLFAIPGLPLIVQIASFVAWSLATAAIGRRWYAEIPGPSRDPHLNRRAERLIGEVVTAAGAFRDGTGRARLGDSVWLARGADAPDGAPLRVTGVEGAMLIVAPLALAGPETAPAPTPASTRAAPDPAEMS